ncbi:MAG: hypothetical protein AAFQ65_10280 [Myxococcota bacterium]
MSVLSALVFSAVIAAGGLDDEDPLDALLALPSDAEAVRPNPERPPATTPTGSVGRSADGASRETPDGSSTETSSDSDEAFSTGFLRLGAQFFMTAEGRFPGTVLNVADEPLVITFLPGTFFEQDENFDAWNVDDVLSPGPRNFYPSTVLTAQGEWQPDPAWAIRALVSTGEIRAGSTANPPSDQTLFFGVPADEFLESGIWLGETVVSTYIGPFAFELGRRFTEIGDGLVYQDVGNGLFASYAYYRGERELVIEASLFATEREFEALSNPSAMLESSIRYGWSFLNWIEIFGASYWDRNGAIDDVLRASRAEAVIEGDVRSELCAQFGRVARLTSEDCQQITLNSVLLDEVGESARLSYLGARGEVQWGRVRTRGRVAAGFGSYEFTDAEGQAQEIRLRGIGGDLDLYASLGPDGGIGLEALGFSGNDDNRLAGRRYNAFIAVAPLWTYSSIFFQNGVNQTFNAARASAAGVNGHGVFGAGPTLEWAPDAWLFELKLLALSAITSSDPRIGGGGRFYGIETDLNASIRFDDHWQMRLISGVLVPGDFFPGDDLAYRVLLSLDASIVL